MAVTAGSIRFNTDTNKMEIYNGDKWWEIDSTSPAEQTGGTRALSAGGASPTNLTLIEFANIDTTGNFDDFGNLAQARNEAKACGSRTRGIIAGGYYDGSDRNNFLRARLTSAHGT